MLNQLLTADLHTLELLDWFWISELFALPTEGGDVADDPGAVLAEAEADHPAALQPPTPGLHYYYCYCFYYHYLASPGWLLQASL